MLKTRLVYCFPKVRSKVIYMKFWQLCLMDPNNESHAFSTSFSVLHGLTSLICIFLSFLSDVTNKRVL